MEKRLLPLLKVLFGTLSFGSIALFLSLVIPKRFLHDVCFRGKDDLAPVFEKFSFSLVYGLPCGPNPGENVQGKYAEVEAFRKEYRDLNGLKIKTK